MADKIVEFNPPKPNELTEDEMPVVAELLYGMYNITACFSGTKEQQEDNAETAQEILGSMISILKQKHDPEVMINLGLRVFKALVIKDERFMHMYNHFVEIKKKFKQYNIVRLN